ncbi:hypothetical protein DFH07DRAFT_993437 [Mycena maculata]|uniref:Uncharacterized protein n=1 Tax=Mycena maculata TaxID=230809 RepID=A0AAD7JXK7_9AGAR|nr:hypothetical protein DFH07DRAFT_993437 [Mycena maculata]
MSTPSAVYIAHLQAIPPSLFFMVPLATIILFFLATSRSIVQHRHDPVLISIQLFDRRKKRVAWVFPVVFSLAFLAIVTGALRFFRERSNSFSLALADSIVTSVLYLELSVSIVYLLSAVANLSTVQPVGFFIYCIIVAIILISATLASIVGSFNAIPPFLAPILYLTMAVLTLPIITYSFLCTSEASLAPQITLSSTCSFPASPSEKPRMLDDEVSSSVEMSQADPPATYATRKLSVYILCGQISAIVHFAFAIGMLVLLPDQSSPPSTLTSEEITTGVWVEALVFRIIQTAFLVLWIICTMSAFLQLFSRVNRSAARNSTLTAMSETTTYTALPPRTHRPKSKSRSSSFSSPRPRRQPVSARPEYPPPPPPRPPRSSDDFRDLHDPFASPSARTSRTAVPGGDVYDTGQRPTRMSAWGTLPPVVPPRPPPNVLVINPPARRLPSLRGLRLTSTPPPENRRSMSIFSYTTPSQYSQEGQTVYEGTFDVEEALLAQKLLRRLDAAGSHSGWGGPLLRRNGSGGSTRGGRHL